MATLMIAPADSSEEGKKRTAISPYDPSFITLLRLSLSLSLPFEKKKKRLTMSKRVSTSDFGRTSGRHYTISLPTFWLLTPRSSNLYRVVFSPGHTTGTHTGIHHSRSICWRRNVVTVSCSILVHLFRSPSPPSKKVRLLLCEGKSYTRKVPASAVVCNNPPR